MNFASQKSLVGSPLRHVAYLRRQAGLSLVELMISITIGLLLLAGVAALISQQSGASAELEKSSRQIENGRYAMQVLKEDIQLAGYYGEYSDVGTLTLPATMPDPCTTALTAVSPALALKDAIPLPIQGYDAPATVPSPLSACLPDANHLAGTDILVIRRADTTTLPTTAAVAGQTYLQSGLIPASPAFNYVLGIGSDAGFTLTKKDAVTLANLRKYLVHIYFVSPCNIPADGSATCTGGTDDNGNPTPTLKRLELAITGSGAGASAAFSVVPLVEGIQNLQLDYGVDYAGPSSILDGAPDCYVSDPTTPTTSEIGACPASAATYFAANNAITNWSNVMAIRVNLLARNNEQSFDYTDAKTYNLGLAGSTTAANDHYKRHAFTELVRAINPSSRRAK